MIDRDKMMSIGHLTRGRTRSTVTEGRDAHGDRFKATTDELGNTVTDRAGDRRDVTINAPHVIATTTTHEQRD